MFYEHLADADDAALKRLTVIFTAIIRLYGDILSGVSLFYLHTLTRKWLFLRQGLMKINQKSSKTAYLDKERTDFASRCNHTNDTISVDCAVDVATALNK